MWGRESPSPREGHGPKMGVAPGTYRQTLIDIRAELRVEEDISIHKGGKEVKGTVSRYIDKNRTGACGLGRNRRLLRHTELVFLSTVCARRVVLVLFTNMDAVN